ncbi:uncharacterized protein LOC111387420 [Olea europaea var. sylvestris]|uniref:uncharacterized protein LOC111387420 n=1 Tax=Olea europaea var. sylvestris TaxID=158386 RepID=UPI000C1D328F|nr:uncharacterized protein LOC111387420 [Olea europaea var. sylvestris]
MALSQPAKSKPLLCTRKSFLILQRLKGTFVEEGCQLRSSGDMGSASGSSLRPSRDNFSKWRKLDSRSLGITRSMISLSSWIVLKILRSAGFDAYLVGGCVRDLLLNKVPKDFDVITTAGLKQIRKKFHSAVIVGRRFPICRVSVKGSIVEVSSFQTVAEQSERKEVCMSQMPADCTQGDLTRWKNCMQRDFTINCLFFDPFVNGIFDYTNAMTDLRSLKLQTVIPAHLSFKEDRGGERNLLLSPSGSCYIPYFLEISRAWLELNYMLSYGAAEPSLLLLHKFKLLEIFLPCHAMYLAKQAGKQPGLRSSMLMRLFFNLDQLITCDRPCDSTLWVALLVFHLALIYNPQQAVVVLTLASVLYHGKWKDSIKFAREHAPDTCIYAPEVLNTSDFLSDNEIAERVTQFVVQVQNSVDLLVDTDCLLKAMASFPEFTCSGLVFISRKMGQHVEHVFKILTKDITSSKTDRNSLEIDYRLLGEGNVREIRFVLGKIILDTLVCGDDKDIEVSKRIKFDSQAIDFPQNMEFESIRQTSICIRKGDSISKIGKKRSLSLPDNELLLDNASKTRYLEGNSYVDNLSENQKTVVCKQPKKMAEIKQDSMEERDCQGVVEKSQEVSGKENVCLPKDCSTNDTENVESSDLHQGAISQMLGKSQHKLTAKKQKVVANKEYRESPEKHIESFEKAHDKVTKRHHMPEEKHHLPKERIKRQGTATGNETSDSPAYGLATEEKEKDELGKSEKQGRRGPKLSSLFK